MNIQLTFAAWMLVPLITTCGCVLFACRTAAEEGWEDAVAMAFVIWTCVTVPALVVAALK